MSRGVSESSHTATEQWQSFELRMRRRRFERCVLRASAALDAGVPQDALEPLEEAERLSPDDPQVRALKVRFADTQSAFLHSSLEGAHSAPSQDGFVDLLHVVPEKMSVFEDARQPLEETELLSFYGLDGAPLEVTFAGNEPALLHSSVVVPVEAGRWRRSLALATVLIVTSSAGGWFWARTHLRVRPQPAGTVALEPQSAPAAPSPTALPDHRPVDAVLPTPVDDALSTQVAMSEESQPAIADEASVDTIPAAASEGTTGLGSASAPLRSISSTASAPVALPPTDERLSPAPVARSPEATDGPPAALTPLTIDLPRETPPALPGPAAAPPTPLTAGTDALSPPPATTAASGAIAPSAVAHDERLVRAALSRYEAAYSGLDAAAARAVWPSVDQRALTRAFQGLESQQVALGRCDVRLNGASAQAECSGTAQWTPKVGGGVQKAARRWRFDLKNTGSDWVIVQAGVR